MKKTILLVLISLVLISCGKKDDSSSDSGGSCSPTKDLFSTWTSRANAAVFIMQGCTYNTNCVVKFGDGACDSARGDFIMYATEDNRIGFADCTNTITLDGADWEIGCDNILKLTYDSDLSTETFE